jgi:SAM-dependent methyltransferase
VREQPGLTLRQAVAVTAETPQQRRLREQRRSLFDGIAERYDATRRGYPAEVVDAVVATAAIGPGAAVLEIGCGTGQLTRQLPAQTVLDLERTRATFLSFSERGQAGFTADLTELLGQGSHVDLVQETILAMAPAALPGPVAAGAG